MNGLVWSPIDARCRQCGALALSATVEIAAHDEGLLDIVVTCVEADDGCGQILNSFQPIDEMMVLA